MLGIWLVSVVFVKIEQERESVFFRCSRPVSISPKVVCPDVLKRTSSLMALISDIGLYSSFPVYLKCGAADMESGEFA